MDRCSSSERIATPEDSPMSEEEIMHIKQELEEILSQTDDFEIKQEVEEELDKNGIFEEELSTSDSQSGVSVVTTPAATDMGFRPRAYEKSPPSLWNAMLGNQANNCPQATSNARLPYTSADLQAFEREFEREWEANNANEEGRLVPRDASALGGGEFNKDSFLKEELPRLCKQLGASSINHLELIPCNNEHQLRAMANFTVTNNGLQRNVQGIFRIGLEKPKIEPELESWPDFEELIPRSAAVGAFLAAHGIPVSKALAYDGSHDNALQRPYDFREIGLDFSLESMYPFMFDLASRVQIALEVAKFNFGGFSSICFPQMGLLEPAIGQLLPLDGAWEPDLGDLQQEYNALDGSTDRPLNPNILPADGKYRMDQTTWNQVPDDMNLNKLIESGLEQQRRKVVAAPQGWDKWCQTFARLGSAQNDPRIEYLNDLEFAFHHMSRLGLLDQYAGNTNVLFTGGTKASSFRAGNFGGLWKITAFTEWDDASSMPALMLFQPPTWLWTSMWTPNDKQEKFHWHNNDDFCLPENTNASGAFGPCTPDDNVVRVAYEQACVAHIRQASTHTASYDMKTFYEDSYGKGRLARMLVEFAITDDNNVESWYTSFKTFVRVWNEYRSTNNLDLPSLPSSGHLLP